MERYLTAFGAMVRGDAAACQVAFDSLPAASSEAEAFMASRIERMLERHGVAVDVAALDERDLRGWHYVLTGGVLLHVAPDEPTGHSRAFNGRYTYLEDSDILIAECLAKLDTVLDLIDGPKSQVAIFDAADSRPVGFAAASQFAAESSLELASDAEGLFVAYDLGGLIEPVRKHFVSHRPGQVLYAHVASAIDEPKPVADIVGVLYERLGATPWSRFAITEPNRTDLPDGPPTETAEELAERIEAVTLDQGELDDLGDICALVAVADALDALATSREDGQREPLWNESPVSRSS